MVSNIKNLLSIERKMIFSNAVTLTNHHFLCITETFLTHDVADDNLFLKNYKIFRNDRKSTSMATSNGGVLLAMPKQPTCE